MASEDFGSAATGVASIPVGAYTTGSFFIKASVLAARLDGSAFTSVCSCLTIEAACERRILICWLFSFCFFFLGRLFNTGCCYTAQDTAERALPDASTGKTSATTASLSAGHIIQIRVGTGQISPQAPEDALFFAVQRVSDKHAHMKSWRLNAGFST